MIIKYRWHDEPDVIKTFDTVKAHNKCPFSFWNKTSQEEYDKHERKLIAEKYKQGLVLEYWIEED